MSQKTSSDFVALNPVKTPKSSHSVNDSQSVSQSVRLGVNPSLGFMAVSLTTELTDAWWGPVWRE